MPRNDLRTGLRGASALMPAAMHLARWELDQGWTWLLIGAALAGIRRKRG